MLLIDLDIFKNREKNLDSGDDQLWLKRVNEDVFQKAFTYCNNQIALLKKSLKEEVTLDSKAFTIYTCCLPYDEVKQYSKDLDFMFSEDKFLRQSQYENYEVALKENQIPLEQIYVAADYQLIEHQLNKKKLYIGKVVTNTGQFEIKVSLCKSQKYLACIRGLQKQFVYNGIRWNGVNCPFAYKFLDVNIVEMERTLTDGEKIQKITVDFDEISKYCRYHMVIMWNLFKINISSKHFPVATYDKVTYKQTLELKKGEEALILLSENKIAGYVVNKVTSIELFSSVRDIVPYSVYKVKSIPEQFCKDYTGYLATNEQKDVFINGFVEQNSRQQIQTEGELIRKLNAYVAFSLFEYKRYRIQEKEPKNTQTYFVCDEVSDRIHYEDRRPSLVLEMALKGEPVYYARDVLSFLVNQIAKYYPQFKVYGELENVLKEGNLI